MDKIKNSPVINFVTINNIGLIPVTRFIIGNFENEYFVTITECRIEDRVQYIKNGKINYLGRFKSRGEFLIQPFRKKIVKYICLGYYLVKIFFQKGKQILYTVDVQVIYLFLGLNRIFSKRDIRLIYHQFELIEEESISGFELRSWKRVIKNSDKIDLFICPELNRLKYFVKLSGIPDEKSMIFPNTLRLQYVNPEIESSSFQKFRKLTDDAFVVGHVGSVGPDHYLNSFISIVNAIENEKIFF